MDPDVLATSPWFLPVLIVSVAADAFFPPIPSELLVIGSGALAADGRYPLAVVILCSTLGCWLGDLALYATFRFGLTRWLDRFRWWRWVHARIAALVAKVGPAQTFTALVSVRFLSGGRTASMAAAGIAGVPWRTFLAASVLGALLWGAFMVGMGALFAAGTDLPAWAVSLIGMGTGIALGTVVAVAVSYVRWRAKTRARK